MARGVMSESAEIWRAALAKALPDGDPQADAFLEHLNRISLLEATARGVAHEIRNPLQALSMAASAMVEEDADEPLLRQLAQVVVESSEALEECVERLVLAAYRRAPAEPEPVALRGLVEAATKIPRSPDNRDLHFQVDLPLDLPAVVVPTGSMRAALLNLLVNAVEAGDAESGPIVVGARVDGTHVRLTVEDRGSGVPPELRERIFAPFVTTRGATGHLGIGLTIARRYARQWGGDVELEEVEGVGTRVALIMPVLG